MSDPKEQQQAEDEVAEDLTVPQSQAEEVGGGDISFNYSKIEVKYEPQHP